MSREWRTTWERAREMIWFLGIVMLGAEINQVSASILPYSHKDGSGTRILIVLEGGSKGSKVKRRRVQFAGLL